MQWLSYSIVRKVQTSSCLFTEGHQIYLSSVTLSEYQNSVMFKYCCITEFVYVHQATANLAKLEIFFQKKLDISNLLIITIVVLFKALTPQKNFFRVYSFFSSFQSMKRLPISKYLEQTKKILDLLPWQPVARF